MANSLEIISIEHDSAGNKKITFKDGRVLSIPPGFQADFIDGRWIIVPMPTGGPPESPV